MDKYVIAPPSGSTNNGVGAADRKWKEGYFEKLAADDVVAKGPVVDVRAFGAKGDGVTDDTAAIQAALNKTGVVMLEPNCVYLITSQLKIKSNTIFEGNFSTIKADGEWDISQYSVIHNENLAMDYTHGNKNIVIKNLKVDATINKERAGKHGVIQFRGVDNGKIDNVEIICNGYDNWGINLMSTNRHINIANCKIINSAEEGTKGGCLWVRSGLSGQSDEYASYDIHINNIYAESTAVDELIVVCDAINNTRTEVSLNNITVINKTQSNHPAYLMCFYAIGSDSTVNVSLNNVTVKGTCTGYAIALNTEGVGTVNKYQANNVNISVTGKGLKYGAYTNSIIETTDQATLNCDLDNCIINTGTVYGGTVNNCRINSSGRGCENCSLIINSIIISSDSIAIHTYGSITRARYINNQIESTTYGIYAQKSTTSALTNTIITGNTFRRSTNETSNAGSYAIYAPDSDYLQMSNNIIYKKDVDGNYYGYRNTIVSSGSHNISANNISNDTE